VGANGVVASPLAAVGGVGVSEAIAGRGVAVVMPASRPQKNERAVVWFFSTAGMSVRKISKCQRQDKSQGIKRNKNF